MEDNCSFFEGEFGNLMRRGINFWKNNIFRGFLFPGNIYAESGNFSGEFRACSSAALSTDLRGKCIGSEIGIQENRLNSAYKKIIVKISCEDRNYLDTVQLSWISGRDGNYNFLSERVTGELLKIRMTSLNFLLNSVYDRASELEQIDL